MAAEGTPPGLDHLRDAERIVVDGMKAPAWPRENRAIAAENLRGPPEAGKAGQPLPVVALAALAIGAVGLAAALRRVRP